jgi:hypothetical protein
MKIPVAQVAGSSSERHHTASFPMCILVTFQRRDVPISQFGQGCFGRKYDDDPWGFAQDRSSKSSAKRVTPLPITFALFCSDEGKRKTAGQSRDFPGFSYFYYMNSHENNCSDGDVRKVSVSAMLYRNIADQIDR